MSSQQPHQNETAPYGAVTVRLPRADDGIGFALAAAFEHDPYLPDDMINALSQLDRQVQVDRR